MQVFVTGSAGFIGTAFVRRLLRERGEKPLAVRAFDIQPTQVEECERLQGSILDPSVLTRAVKGCDLVVHLAAYLGVRQSDQNRLRCLNINVTGTKNVLAACAAHRIRRVVFASSSEVYGDNRVSPVSEASALSPQSVYAVSKLAGEEYVKAYATHYGFEYTILRLFNVFGPQQIEEFVIPRFVRAALERRPPLVYGTGQQVRSFCYVDDIVEGLVLALSSPEAAGEAFNLGNDAEPISIIDLAHEVVALSGKGGPASQLVPYTQADRPMERDVMCRIPDIQKAKRVLGYVPKVSREEGLVRLFNSMANSLKSPGASSS